jgi:hypothetical protein
MHGTGQWRHAEGHRGLSDPGRQDESRCWMRRPNPSPRRSTARLMAAYTCVPLTRILSEPAGSRLTVTTQVTLSQVPRSSV